MDRRCPDNKLVGSGVLREWKWIINARGFANVIRSREDVVYGLVYEISSSDEASLDNWEGFPWAYTKHTIGIELESENNKGGSVQALVYIDEIRTGEGVAWKEYVHRINLGINDAAARGLPGWYTDKYIRRFIPAEEEKEVLEAFKPEEEAHHHGATDVTPKL